MWEVTFLSFCGRLKFGVTVHDWCGIREIRKEVLDRMELRCDGMESRRSWLRRQEGKAYVFPKYL